MTGGAVKPPENMIQFQRAGKFHAILPQKAHNRKHLSLSAVYLRVTEEKKSSRIQQEIFLQSKTRQPQTYFVYFKAGAAQLWGKRSAEDGDLF